MDHITKIIPGYSQAPGFEVEVNPSPLKAFSVRFDIFWLDIILCIYMYIMYIYIYIYT